MANTIRCPHCDKEVEITEALTHQIEEQVLLDEREKFQKTLTETEERVRKEANEKARAGMEIEIKKASEEAKEERERATKLQEQILELTKEIRRTRNEAEEKRVEMEKKLAEDEEKIKLEARKAAEDEQHLKLLEKEKMLTDALKKNEELRTKLQQGSQQNQGEVLELEIERLLQEQFPQDNIKEVPKGIRGADVIQEVCDKNGNVCGTILWETKNAKWSNSWVGKLKDDQRALQSDIAILISQNLPEDIKTFSFKRGVWVTNRASAISLATALRISIYQVYVAKRSSEGKNEKVEMLYNYLTGVEFRQRVEAIVESFDALNKEIDTERRWFNTKWSRQEKEIRKALEHTFGMYGSLQSVIGSALPELKSLSIPGEAPTQQNLLEEK